MALTLGFGDSITVGTGASDAAHRWLNIVAAVLSHGTLQNSGIVSTVLQNTVQNTVATIGAAADNNGRDTYHTRISDYVPDYVFILYGLNDLRLNDAAFSAALFANDLGEIIDNIVADTGMAAANIVIGSPPYMTNYTAGAPWNAGTIAKHQAYVAQCAAVAAAKGCKYADVYQYMIDHGGDSLISGDGIHPNNAGHAAIADCFLSAFTGTTGHWLVVWPDATDGKDTSLYKSSPTVNAGIYGNVSAGRIVNDANVQRALIRFDLSLLPATAFVGSATFYLVVANAGLTYPGTTIDVYEVSAANGDWPEGVRNQAVGGAGDSCWNFKDQGGAGTAWAGSAGLSTAGIDYVNTIIGTFTIPNPAPMGTIVSATLTPAVVQGWRTRNPGMLLRGTIESGSDTGGYFRSSDNGVSTNCPLLVVFYTLLVAAFSPVGGEIVKG